MSRMPRTPRAPRSGTLRALALAICAALPLSAYAAGDLADAFPGVLTLERAETVSSTLPPAAAEDADLAPVPRLVPDAAAQPVSDPSGLQQRMDAHAALPVVDGDLAYAVVDAASGEVLASRDAATPRTPASTLKLLTAIAVLQEYAPDQTLPTTAVLDGETLALVGGGDMMLTREKLDQLAGEAAALAQESGTVRVRLVLDDSLITGGQNPAWGNNGTAGGWVTPTAALAVDMGWLDGEQYGPKSTDPAGDAAELFAELLREHGLEVTTGEGGRIERGTAPSGGQRAEVQSAPIGEIVQHTLMISDNTTAELLAHLMALAHGEEATPATAAQAVREEIAQIAAELGVPQEDIDLLRILDGSGLSRDNRVTPRLFTEVIAAAASGTRPELAPILLQLPVAHLTGTLAERFTAADLGDARGVVRGKTGYLGGAATLAGVATTPDGRTVTFSIVVHGFDGVQADAARAAVDEVAAEIVETG